MSDIVNELRKNMNYESVIGRKRPHANRWQVAIEVFELAVAIAVVGLLGFVAFGWLFGVVMCGRHRLRKGWFELILIVAGCGHVSGLCARCI
jgi:hypothetical protein